jgi:hypothetical protein
MGGRRPRNAGPAGQRMATDPLILPLLMGNRGFTAGLLLGLAFFAAVNGLAYVVSLFFQTALGLARVEVRACPTPSTPRLSALRGAIRR